MSGDMVLPPEAINIVIGVFFSVCKWVNVPRGITASNYVYYDKCKIDALHKTRAETMNNALKHKL